MSRAQPSILFERWPRFATRHPWSIVSFALAAVVGLGVLFVLVGGRYADSFNLPGTESQRLIDLLEERFPESAGDSATIVVRVPDGVDSQRAQVDALMSELETLPEVIGVSSPFDQQGAISADGTIARINVQYAKQGFDLERSTTDALLGLVADSSTESIQVEAGGQVVRASEQEPPGSAELIGLSAAVIILLLAFGSVVAAGIPILTALMALTSGFFVVGIGASFFDMVAFTPQFSAMIGIGVGIDYSLLIVTRYREGLALGLSVDDAVVEAQSTAGRSVAFAGSAVIIALVGLWAVGIPFVGFVGSAAAVVVALSVLVAIVVLPAALKLAGTHVDRWRVPLLAAPAHESETGVSYRWSRLVQRAPLLFAALSVAILLTLAAPVLDMRLGSSDAGGNPTSLTSRRAYDLLAEGFGVGFNGPVLIGAAIDDPDTSQAVGQLPDLIEQQPGVASVSPPRFNQAGTAATISVIPATAPQDEETEQLIHRLRDTVPETLHGSGARAFVGGPTAVFIDVGDKIESRLPIFFLGVIGLSFLLLMAVFRSIVVPIKAALMNILSIGAAYGVLVAVFQWGWFAGLLGVPSTGPIESFLPMMLFAVLFGLSMDYEVFLVSRIQEEYLRTGNNTEAVARGLSVTTRVISAAAAIMVAVFLAFVAGDQRIVKEFGVGLATAIFVDATLVRLVLVPSIMQLVGNANWWFPRWLDRIVPRLGLHEGNVAAPALAGGAQTDGPTTAFGRDGNERDQERIGTTKNT